MTRDSELLPQYRTAWMGLGWLMASAVALGSLWPSMPQVPGGVSDKFLHFSAYAALAFMFAGVLERRHWGRVVVGLLLFGAGIEFAQEHLIKSRAGEWQDMAANAAGVAVGMLTAALLPHSWCRHVEILAGLDRKPS